VEVVIKTIETAMVKTIENVMFLDQQQHQNFLVLVLLKHLNNSTLPHCLEVESDIYPSINVCNQRNLRIHKLVSNLK